MNQIHPEPDETRRSTRFLRQKNNKVRTYAAYTYPCRLMHILEEYAVFGQKKRVQLDLIRARMGYSNELISALVLYILCTQ